MKISKKWLPVSAMALLCATLLTGCSEEEKVAPTSAMEDKNTPALAIKNAYPKLWSESYNYNGQITIDIKADESALIGTQGGLTKEEAEQELEILKELESGSGKQMISMLKDGKFTYHGAYDGKNAKADAVLGMNVDMNGLKLSLDIPLLVEMKDEIAFYIDPKAAKAFVPMPPQIDGKLIKMTLNDIPDLTAEQKAKFSNGSEWLKKFEDISNAQINNMDASLFKDIDVSEAAKEAGAIRSVQVTITPEQNQKMSNEMVAQFLDTFGPDVGLTAEEIAEAKKDYQESNQNMKLFMSDTVTEYGLNKDGQIVYMTSAQSFKGAKHVGNMNVEMTLKDFGKPTFTVDPTKQGTVSITELMMSMM